MEELKERLIALEQKQDSYEAETHRKHTSLSLRIDQKVDKDDFRELKKDIQNDFSERDERITRTRSEVQSISNEQARVRFGVGMIVTFLGGVGWIITKIVDKWDKIKGYLD